MGGTLSRRNNNVDDNIEDKFHDLCKNSNGNSNNSNSNNGNSNNGNSKKLNRYEYDITEFLAIVLFMYMYIGDFTLQGNIFIKNTDDQLEQSLVKRLRLLYDLFLNLCAHKNKCCFENLNNIRPDKISFLDQELLKTTTSENIFERIDSFNTVFLENYNKISNICTRKETQNQRRPVCNKVYNHAEQTRTKNLFLHQMFEEIIKLPKVQDIFGQQITDIKKDFKYIDDKRQERTKTILKKLHEMQKLQEMQKMQKMQEMQTSKTPPMNGGKTKTNSKAKQKTKRKSKCTNKCPKK